MTPIKHNGSFKPYGSNRMIVIDEITITLSNIKNITHTITIPEGFVFDGATIHWLAWLVIGPPFEPDFIIPACVHDYYCMNAESYNDRVIGDAVFLKLLAEENVPYWKRALMYLAVRLYAIFRIKHK